MRRQIKRTEERLVQLREREERFEPGEMPGMAVIRRLFTGIDPYLTALGFTPRGTGRPPARMRSEHQAQAQRVLDALHAGHRQLLAFLDRSVAASESELRYQRERNGGEGRVETDLDELEAAGLVDAEVRVYYRLTSEGRRRLKSSPAGLELRPWHDAPGPRGQARVHRAADRHLPAPDSGHRRRRDPVRPDGDDDASASATTPLTPASIATASTARVTRSR